MRQRPEEKSLFEIVVAAVAAFAERLLNEIHVVWGGPRFG